MFVNAYEGIYYLLFSPHVSCLFHLLGRVGVASLYVCSTFLFRFYDSSFYYTNSSSHCSLLLLWIWCLAHRVCMWFDVVTSVYFLLLSHSSYHVGVRIRVFSSDSSNLLYALCVPFVLFLLSSYVGNSVLDCTDALCLFSWLIVLVVLHSPHVLLLYLIVSLLLLVFTSSSSCESLSWPFLPFRTLVWLVLWFVYRGLVLLTWSCLLTSVLFLQHYSFFEVTASGFVCLSRHLVFCLTFYSSRVFGSVLLRKLGTSVS